MSARTHTAAEPVLDVQLCARCSDVLIDHRNTSSPAGSGPPRYWAVGAAVVVDGNHSYVANDHPFERPMACSEVIQ